MSERGISQGKVEEILKHPLKVILTAESSIYQGIVNESSKSYLIRIFVNEMVNPGIIITVYKTSKIKKYYEGKIR